MEKETEEWVRFLNLAAAQRKEAVPADIKGKFPEIERFLPAFYRTLRRKKISDKDIKQLLELLKKDETTK